MGDSSQTQKTNQSSLLNTNTSMNQNVLNTMNQNMNQNTNQNNVGTINQVRDPYAQSKPAIDASLVGIQNYLQNPASSAAFDYSPSAMTTKGMGMIGNAAGAQQSSDYLSDVLSGQYLNKDNPWQADLDKSITASVMPSINSTFSGAGMTGSTLHQGSLTQGLTSALAAPRYQNYQQERAAQAQAAGMLPGVESQIGQQQIAAGKMGEDYAQQQFNEKRMSQLRPYQDTASMLQGFANVGGSTTGMNTNQTVGQTVGQTTGMNETETTGQNNSNVTGQTTGKNTSKSSPSLGSQILGGGMMLGGMLGGMPGLGMIGSGLGFGGQNAPQGSLPWQQGYSPFNGWLSGN